MNALKQGNLEKPDRNLLMAAGATDAIADLKNEFTFTTKPKDKIVLAESLVRLGDKDPEWWRYLSEQAVAAINSDMPSMEQFDKNGHVLPDLSPKLLEWTKVHSLTEQAAGERRLVDMLAVLALGESGDPRAIPLLRQALSSQDYIIQSSAAMGLGELGEQASILDHRRVRERTGGCGCRDSNAVNCVRHA